MARSVLNENWLCIHGELPGEANRQQVVDEIVKLHCAPLLLWEWLAALLPDMSPWELQDMVLNGCMCSYMYLSHKAFQVLERQPWSLCQGGAIASIEAPLAGTALVNSLVAHLYGVGTHAGNTQVREHSEVGRSCGHTQTGQLLCFALRETTHCGRSGQEVFHPEVTTFVLCVRAFAHCLRDTVQGVTNEERALASKNACQTDLPARSHDEARGSQQKTCTCRWKSNLTA
eukprot:1333353-Amphidinium_carterae.2